MIDDILFYIFWKTSFDTIYFNHGFPSPISSKILLTFPPTQIPYLLFLSLEKKKNKQTSHSLKKTQETYI